MSTDASRLGVLYLSPITSSVCLIMMDDSGHGLLTIQMRFCVGFNLDLGTGHGFWDNT